MSELISYIVASLVEFPDQIEIQEIEENGLVHIKLKVADTDTGKVIGRQGRIAKAVRSILKSASSKADKRYVLDII